MGVRVLIVDDEPAIRDVFTALLSDEGYEVASAESALDALAYIVDHDIDVLVTDLVMPGKSGLYLLEQVAERWPNVGMIAITGEPHVDSASRAMRAGARDYLAKPIDFDRLLQSVSMAAAPRTGERLAAPVGTSRESELRDMLAKVLETTMDGYVMVELPTTYILDVNEAFATMHGQPRASLVGRRLADMEPDATDAAINARVAELRRQGHLRFAANHAAPDGKTMHVECSASIMRDTTSERAVVFVRDVTERDQLQRKLGQQQKLEALGTLASGVAHEINNPVQGIVSYASLIKRRGQGDEVTRYADQIVREAGRVATIVRNLLTFARQESEDYSVANVRDLVDDTLSLVGASLRSDQISLAVNIPRDLPAVACRTQQIQQVLMNLLTNARDALTEQFPDHDDDKLIELEAAAFERDSSTWVSIAVQDRGGGVPPDIADRIFDPFFTTKSRNRGTGLGLSVSHGIVADHGGALRHEAAPKGARFVVELRARGSQRAAPG